MLSREESGRLQEIDKELLAIEEAKNSEGTAVQVCVCTVCISSDIHVHVVFWVMCPDDGKQLCAPEKGHTSIHCCWITWTHVQGSADTTWDLS